MKSFKLFIAFSFEVALIAELSIDLHYRITFIYLLFGVACVCVLSEVPPNF